MRTHRLRSPHRFWAAALDAAARSDRPMPAMRAVDRETHRRWIEEATVPGRAPPPRKRKVKKIVK